MNIIQRAKNILLSPNTEWDVISSETPDTTQIITGYVLPLSLLAAAAAFIGYSFIGFSSFGMHIGGISWGLYHAIAIVVNSILSVFITAFVIDALAPSFASEKNMGRSIQLVAYSMTASWVGGLFALLPAIALIGALLSLYGLYIMYLGMARLKRTPPDKHAGYFIVSLVVLIIVYFVIGGILGRILMGIMGLSYGVIRM